LGRDSGVHEETINNFNYYHMTSSANYTYALSFH